MILPLLPANRIQEALDILITESNEFGELFRSFINYFKKIWMRKYGVDKICVYGKNQRTNNAVESFNGELKDSIRVAHGNFWRVISKFYFLNFLIIIIHRRYNSIEKNVNCGSDI